MSMNKKEQAQMAEALRQRDMAIALRFRSEPLPERMQAPDWGEAQKVGWHAHVYHGIVHIEPGCFTAGWHSVGDTQRIRSQGCGEFFATRLDALLVARHRMALQAAENLASLDAQIEKERLNPTPMPNTAQGRKGEA